MGLLSQRVTGGRTVGAHVEKSFAIWKCALSAAREVKIKLRLATRLQVRRLSSLVLAAWQRLVAVEIETRREDTQRAAGELERARLVSDATLEHKRLAAEVESLQRRLELEIRSKNHLQENLKRVFMRGVCALNFEAMTLLSNPVPGEGNGLSGLESFGFDWSGATAGGAVPSIAPLGDANGENKENIDLASKGLISTPNAVGDKVLGCISPAASSIAMAGAVPEMQTSLQQSPCEASATLEVTGPRPGTTPEQYSGGETVISLMERFRACLLGEYGSSQKALDAAVNSFPTQWITCTEFEEFVRLQLPSQRHNIGRSEASRIFQALDKNGHGRVSLQELFGVVNSSAKLSGVSNSQVGGSPSVGTEDQSTVATANQTSDQLSFAEAPGGAGVAPSQNSPSPPSGGGLPFVSYTPSPLSTVQRVSPGPVPAGAPNTAFDQSSARSKGSRWQAVPAGQAVAARPVVTPLQHRKM